MRQEIYVVPLESNILPSNKSKEVQLPQLIPTSVKRIHVSLVLLLLFLCGTTMTYSKGALHDLLIMVNNHH